MSSLPTTSVVRGSFRRNGVMAFAEEPGIGHGVGSDTIVVGEATAGFIDVLSIEVIGSGVFTMFKNSAQSGTLMMAAEVEPPPPFVVWEAGEHGML